MTTTTFFIGIDIASDEHSVAVFQPGVSERATMTMLNTPQGFEEFLGWAMARGCTRENSIICIENTGVYGESLTYYLAAERWRIAVEAPQKVKRGMGKQSKNDTLDAKQIAEYAYRYEDTLHFWQAPEAVLERLRTLLTTRRHCDKEKTSVQNMLKAFERKVVRTPSAEALLHKQEALFIEQLSIITTAIADELKSNSEFQAKVDLADSVPGVGMLMGVQLLVMTNGFRERLDYKQLASYLGICPHEHSSGTSVYRKPKSRQSGPSEMRKLLHLAAMSVLRTKTQFPLYFAKKKAIGKEGPLILNSIANKLLKILCAVINSGKKFDSKYISLPPISLPPKPKFA